MALLPADDLRMAKIADFNLVFAGEFQSDFDCLGAAAGEVNGSASIGRPGKIEQFAGVFFSDWCSELAVVDKLHRAGLLGHRRDDFRDAVADEVDGHRT